MDDLKLELFWNDIPIGINNAITYPELIEKWGINEREVRKRLHALSIYDNGDDFVLVRSSLNKGFFRTDNYVEIKIYKNECLRKGRSVFAPVKKINRILKANTEQYTLENNLRVIRESKNMTQNEVCEILQKWDTALDKAMLSKFENSVCLPTPAQLTIMAEIYAVTPAQLINSNLYY